MAVTIALYVVFTFKVTEWRVQIRKRMNEQDTNANQKAIDSLLNFETVKYFSAEEREAERYDVSMRGYEQAAVETSLSLAGLNFGQSLIITAGLVGVMVLGALGVANSSFTVGEFVMVNAYMVQITMPLNFLGTVYREIRQALVDMGEMFDLLEQPAEIADRPGAPDLEVSEGRLEFDNVVFDYETDRPILARTGPDRAGRTDGCRGRAVGVGQVDHRAAVVPVLRRAKWRRADRWAGPARGDAIQPPAPDRRGAAGHGTLQRHHRLQHRLWPPRGQPGRGRGCSTSGTDPRLHRFTAAGL